jgi:hypothetical protein
LLGSDLYWGLGVKKKERGSVANVAVEGEGSQMVVTMKRFLEIDQIQTIQKKINKSNFSTTLT